MHEPRNTQYRSNRHLIGHAHPPLTRKSSRRQGRHHYRIRSTVVLPPLSPPPRRRNLLLNLTHRPRGRPSPRSLRRPRPRPAGARARRTRAMCRARRIPKTSIPQRSPRRRPGRQSTARLRLGAHSTFHLSHQEGSPHPSPRDFRYGGQRPIRRVDHSGRIRIRKTTRPDRRDGCRPARHP